MMAASSRYSDDDVRAALEREIASEGSLRKLSERVGVSPSYISMVRQGKAPPGAMLAEVLGFIEDGRRWVRRSAAAK